MLLERVMVHQTRLRTPGLGLDARGVALGQRGLVLLPSLDRLVAFLALYTRGGSLAELARSLRVEIVKSKLGAREVAFSFGAESSDRMDKIADVARLAGGYVFTGSSRHFVQYRDAGAPFGYDVQQIAAGDSALQLYHSAFGQGYDVEKAIELPALLLRLELAVDPSAGGEAGDRWASAEGGLGPALVGWFARSSVDADVAVATWPPASSFDDQPVERYLFRIRALPPRMIPLLRKTPGLTLYAPAGPAAAVEVGYRHPVNLRACPVFADGSLVLFRGRREEPLVVPRLPAFGHVSAFARVEIRERDGAVASSAASEVPAVAVPLRVFPTVAPFRGVSATWLQPEELPLLRRLAYALPRETVANASIAVTKAGAFVRSARGIEGIPLGTFFTEVHPDLFLPAGWEASPRTSPEVLHRALGASPEHVLFIAPTGRAFGVPRASFAPLEGAILEGHAWAPLQGTPLDLEPALSTAIPEIVLEPLGFRPMRDVSPAEAGPE